MAIGNGFSSGVIALFFMALLVLNFVTTEVEGRMCKTPSGKFKGPCGRSSNCKNVCRTEGFPTGNCDFHVANRKCYCYKPC